MLLYKLHFNVICVTKSTIEAKLNFVNVYHFLSSAETSPSQDLIPLPYHSKELACQSSDSSALQPSAETIEKDCDSVIISDHPQEDDTSDFIFPCQPDTVRADLTQCRYEFYLRQPHIILLRKAVKKLLS